MAKAILEFPVLLWSAAVFNGFRTIFLVGSMVIFFLPQQNKWLWPITILLFPIAASLFCLSLCLQLPSCLCALAFHARAGVRVRVQSDGIKTKDNLTIWNDIARIRRVYEREFLPYHTRFENHVAYQIGLQSGAEFYVDFIDENSLLAHAQSREIALEGFDKRLQADDYE